MKSIMRSLMISAPESNSGKTIVSVAIIRAMCGEIEVKSFEYPAKTNLRIARFRTGGENKWKIPIDFTIIQPANISHVMK